MADLSEEEHDIDIESEVFDFNNHFKKISQPNDGCFYCRMTMKKLRDWPLCRRLKAFCFSTLDI